MRFKVGEDLETALVRLNQKLQPNFDRIPPGVTSPLIKPKRIDDVPILALTFHSSALRSPDAAPARRAGGGSGQTGAAGGRNHADRRRTRRRAGAARSGETGVAQPEPGRHRADAPAGEPPVPRRRADHRQPARCWWKPARFSKPPRTSATSSSACSAAVRSICARSPRSSMAAGEPAKYVLYWPMPRRPMPAARSRAVTLTDRQAPGRQCHRRGRRSAGKSGRAQRHDHSRRCRRSTVTRNYGETAAEKSNELLLHMGIAVFSVAILILLTLGWRESVMVAVAIPATLALTLLVFYLYGFTLNRITLFALIFTIGILVDDAIVVVENIVRHFHLPQNKGRNCVRHRRGGRGRSRQSHHPRHLRGDRRGAADGFRRRPDGALHAADPDRCQRGDVLVAADRLHRHAVGVDPDPALGQEILDAHRRHASARRRQHARMPSTPRTSSPNSTAVSWVR